MSVRIRKQNPLAPDLPVPFSPHSRLCWILASEQQLLWTNPEIVDTAAPSLSVIGTG